MRRLALITAALVLPISVLALDYTNSSPKYEDAPFTKPEAAGISVLTNVGAVEGNPDGTFAPGKTLNRAEFVKIVLLSVHADLEADFPECFALTRAVFPDVPRTAWFAPFVCAAKREGMVQGYPDGFFHPERSVNYAEAIKILATLHGYSIEHLPDEEWFDPYVIAANERKTLLGGIPLANSLTRGQMARLAAAFLAESKGELARYRTAERGGTWVESSSSVSSAVSSSSSSSSVSSSSSSSSFSSSSASSVSDLPELPPRARFLIVGERSEPIAAATFFASKEAMIILGAEVKLDQDVRSIDAMYLIDDLGKQVGQIYLDRSGDATLKTWRGTFASSGAYRIPKDQERLVAIEVLLKGRDLGGISEEVVLVKTFRLTLRGEDSGADYNSASASFTYPSHQTAQGGIASVANAIDANGALPLGVNQLLAAFSVTAKRLPQQIAPAIESIEFQVNKSASVSVTNWQLGIPDSPDRVSCTTNGTIVSCDNVSSLLGSLDATPRTMRLFGDVSVASNVSDAYLQVTINQPGTIAGAGAIRWTDGTGHFVWTDLPSSPIARGTLWK